jgi:MFS family permease
MTAVTLDAADRRRSLAAIIGAGFGTGMAMGSTLPLLTLLMERDGLDSVVIGANAAMFPLGVLCCGPFVPLIARRLGTLPAIYASLAIFAAAIPLYWLSPFWLWFPIRFVAGGAGALYWIVSETWINLVATDSNRGRVTALYAMVLTAGFTLGPIIIGAVGIDGFAPFAIALAANLLVVAPMPFVRRLAPDLSGQASMRVRRGFAAAPTLFVAVVAGGCADMAAIAMLPIYGLEGGLDRAGAAFLLAVFTLGNAILQWPLGWLADRFGRYRMLVVTVAMVLLGALLLPLVADTRWPLWILLFVWGGVGFGVYTVALALLGERIPPAELAAANALFVMVYEVGSLSGPVLAGGAMDLVGRQGMPLVIGLAAAGFLVFAAMRRRS